MAKLQEPGEKPAGPGEYLEVGPRGGEVVGAMQVIISSNDGHLPPTSRKGNNWKKLPRRRC
ncbi:YjzC family protein [Kushneria aurantia]|uniref:YjzC family protein n=1 Tax=Kushneria aurantia TaxID=504092 RepID=A0ABV6G4R5_9GAMM